MNIQRQLFGADYLYDLFTRQADESGRVAFLNSLDTDELRSLRPRLSLRNQSLVNQIIIGRSRDTSHFKRRLKF